MASPTTTRLLTVRTAQFIAARLRKKYPDGLVANIRNDLGLSLMQARVQIELSSRLFAEAPRWVDGFYTVIFYAELCAYVDAYRAQGHSIKAGLMAYMAYAGITEDEITLDTLTKMYDRHRTTL